MAESGYDAMSGPVLGSDTLIRHIRAARDDGSVRAIVVRVDSPGGSAVASDAITTSRCGSPASVGSNAPIGGVRSILNATDFLSEGLPAASTAW